MNFYTLTSKLYDVLDVTYFNKQRKNPRVAINELIQGENVSILDMCCGTLSNTISIANTHKDANILGIDISKQMLQVAQKKIEKNHLGNICLRELDATDTSLESNRFYHCNKSRFFENHNFKVFKLIHCNYSAIFELKKVVNSD